MDSIPAWCASRAGADALIGMTRSRNATPSASPGLHQAHWLVPATSTIWPRVLHEGVLRRQHRTAGPGPGRCAKECSSRSAPIIRRPSRRACVVCAAGEGRRGADPQGGGAVWLAKRPVIYSGGVSSIRAGSVKAVARTGRSHRISLTSPDGSRRLSGVGQELARMLGMHGTYEPTWRCTAATPCCASARASTGPASPDASDAFSPDSKKIHIDIDRLRSTRTSASRFRSSGSGNVLAICCQVFKAEAKSRTSPLVGRRSRNGARAIRCRTGRTTIHPAAIPNQRLLRGDARRDVYITTEVGQHQIVGGAVLGLRGAAPLDDFGGLGTMGYGLPAAVRSRSRIPTVW